VLFRELQAVGFGLLDGRLERQQRVAPKESELIEQVFVEAHGSVVALPGVAFRRAFMTARSKRDRVGGW